jgi:multiple sugar transport system substrate-binding protein
LKYLESEPAMTTFTYALANLPARKSLLTARKYRNIPGFSFYLNSLRSRNLKGFSNAPWAAEYLNDLNSEIGYVTDLKETPEAAMAKVKQEIMPSVGSFVSK